MHTFFADLHIHSRFSHATSSKLNAATLALWAKIKGLQVIGTGDITHPTWRAELADNLAPDEASGLFVLKDPSLVESAAVDFALADTLASVGSQPVYFMLQGEISCIYKRGGKTRRVHNLVYLPTFEAAETLSKQLAKIGNIASDGRPILKLDSADLLHMVLESAPQAFLIPAHVWTPWYSLFGAKSGFDTLDGCFGGLTKEIFALETGLSSDPAMNRLWSDLDALKMVSNSDAHSAENLGREATMFAGNISYTGILGALAEGTRARAAAYASTATRYMGTVEFFPEEGKYHMDGHRKCQQLLSPAQTREYNGRCPVCNGLITVGVLHRVTELADRQEPLFDPSIVAPGVIPLVQLWAELVGASPSSKKVQALYMATITALGPELEVLLGMPEATIANFSVPLSRAIEHMRLGKVHKIGGYDGVYGVICAFTPEERLAVLAEHALLEGDASASKSVKQKTRKLTDIEVPVLSNKAKPSESSSGRDKKKSPHEASGVIEQPLLLTDALPTTKIRRRIKPSHKEKAPNDEFVFSTSPEDDEFIFEPADTVIAEQPLSLLQPAARTQTMPSLSPAQQEIVRMTPQPVVVLGGAGTGKTRMLADRMVQLLDDGIAARRIIAITPSRFGAIELDGMMQHFLGKNVPLPRTDTFVGFALEFWHRQHRSLPILLSDSLAWWTFAGANAQENPKKLGALWQMYTTAKTQMLPQGGDMAVCVQRYVDHKKASNLADVYDVLDFWLEYLHGGSVALPYSHILVDEVENLDPLEAYIVRALLSASGEGFFGVANPLVCKSWDLPNPPHALAFFGSTYPALQQPVLDTNQRSAKNIMLCTHALADKIELPEQLKFGAACPAPVRVQQGSLHLFAAPSESDELDWLTATIQEYTDQSKVAVLLRSSALARHVAAGLRERNLHVVNPAGDNFWHNKRIQSILFMVARSLGIRLPADITEASLLCSDAILQRGPLAIAAYLSTVPPFTADFWESAPFRAFCKAYEISGGWPELLTWIALQRDEEQARSQAEAVQVLTFHEAQGREFSKVFLPCFEDGLVPFAGASLLSGKIDGSVTLSKNHELRLAYLALSRTRTDLYISYAAKRVVGGQKLQLLPSSYLPFLPLSLFTTSSLEPKAPAPPQQLSLLE